MVLVATNLLLKENVPSPRLSQNTTSCYRYDMKFETQQPAWIKAASSYSLSLHVTALKSADVRARGVLWVNYQASMQPRLWRTSMQTIEVRCSHRAGHFRRHQLKRRSRFWRSNFWTPERLSSYIFSLPWFYVPTNFQYETLYILYSRPTPFPPSLHADWSDMMNSCAGSSDIFVNLRLHDFQLHLPGLYHFAFKFFVENRYRYLR